MELCCMCLNPIRTENIRFTSLLNITPIAQKRHLNNDNNNWQVIEKRSTCFVIKSVDFTHS